MPTSPLGPRLVWALSLTAALLAPVSAQEPERESQPSQNQAPEKPAARPEWYGVLDAGPRVFRFVIEAEPSKEGQEVHLLRSIDEGERRFRLDPYTVDQDQKQFTFELKASQALYTSELSDDGLTATGKWKQSGNELDLVFRRITGVPADVPDELWVGKLNLVVQKLELRFRIYNQPEGPPKVFMDSTTQEAGGFKVERRIDDDEWTFEVPGVRGTFTGTRNAEGTELTGAWKQNVLSLPLQLTKEDPELPVPVKVVVRPQTPQPPFPYSSEEVTFPGLDDSVKLNGTLTIPAGEGRHPALILISGSGPQDRDETLLDHKPFWVLADHLSRRGFAVLRYDERGVGESTGKFETATSEDFSRDVEAALNFLQLHERIAIDQIGLIGHSEGGLVAPMVAARRPDVACLVLMAGTGVDGEQILLSQGTLIMQAEGLGTEEELKLQRVLQGALLRLIKEANDGDSVEQLTQQALDKARSLVSVEIFEKEELEEKIKLAMQQFQSPWLRFFIRYDPAPTLRRVKCPVLALNGEKDLQVDPKLNLPAIHKALTEGGNPDFEVRQLASLNHLFQTSKTGAVSEYEKIEETLAPAFLEAVTNWLQPRLRDN